MADALFYLLSAAAVAGAAGVVLSKSPMASVLSLLGTFFCLAVIYLLLGFQFLAAAQILVYAGAILVLFLFVIMLLDLASLAPKEPLLRGRAGIVAAVLAMGIGLAGLLAAQGAALPPPDPAAAAEGIDDLHALAIVLFGRYGLAFEAASVLLLATMIAVMTLAKRHRAGAAPARGLSLGMSPPAFRRDAEIEAREHDGRAGAPRAPLPPGAAEPPGASEPHRPPQPAGPRAKERP